MQKYRKLCKHKKFSRFFFRKKCSKCDIATKKTIKSTRNSTEIVNDKKITTKLLGYSKFLLPLQRQSPDGEMVDALVSGASVERRVGSSPILGTSGYRKMTAFFMPRIGLANDRRSRAKAPSERGQRKLQSSLTMLAKGCRACTNSHSPIAS